ncbi:MAG: LysM peptidoglycan-binding domain-containing protein [Thermodesulfobacteriaceae bacterium]|nr:LysM peptidoglycan-binding domain-containing protein [Thermodesulfobacteriaceae bacterium]MCX8041368.1 LysM peptidoglycan-binding domain-containing protein [Thermodesulfobacteriaceae bacterium]MDW8135626.1 LysM peptidoglycan-binding domain-containing protein [Thermodesulfobacterium sp.]
MSFFFLFFWTKEALTKNLTERTSKTKKVKKLTSKSNLISKSSFKNKRKKYKVLENNSFQNLTYYEVKKGDTLYSIAKRHGISVEELKNLNNLGNSALKPGQKLIISKNHSKKVFKVEKIGGINTERFNFSVLENRENEFIYYKVQKGDTLFRVAKKHGLTVEELKNLNNLEDDVLTVGQQLKVPNIKNLNLSENFVYHLVQEGETLYRISLKYGIPIELIKKINNLQENIIIVGQVLKIPISENLEEEPFIFENPIAYYQEEEETLKQKFEKMRLEREKFHLKEKFLQIAEDFQSIRYRLGGNGNGYLDCSMFVKLVYQRLGIDLPRSSLEQFKLGKEVEKKELLPGDLVFFRTRGRNISHVGIYLGENKFIHVSSRRKGLAIDSLEEDYYRIRYAGAKRILNLQ